jgi:hypothetical protein
MKITLLILLLLVFLWIMLGKWIYLHFKGTIQLVPEYFKKEQLDVVISLTTTPSRIERMKYTINSLLTQTKKVKEIRVNLPKKTLRGEEYSIPEWLEMLQPIVRIVRCERDYGPATKIIPTLLSIKEEDQKIIYLDDDTIYFPQLIETLVSLSEKNPSIVIAFSGDTKEKLNFLPDGLTKVKVVHGWGGVLVKPKFFDLTVIEEIPSELLFMDDHYLSLRLQKKNVDRGVMICDYQFGLNLFSSPFPNWNEMKGVLMKKSDGLSSNVNNSLKYQTGLDYFLSQYS